MSTPPRDTPHQVSWLASYPKSGNTWLRLMIQVYVNKQTDQDGNLDINNTPDIQLYPARRSSFDDILGVNASDLTAAEVLAWRPVALRIELQRPMPPWILKTHDARVFLAPPQINDEGQPQCLPANDPTAIALIPPDVTHSALYLVRDPRNVAPSLAKHLDISLDDAIAVMADDHRLMGGSWSRQAVQLWQFWSSWNKNVDSWLEPAPFPVRVIRYEDMRANPEQALTQALETLGFSPDPLKVTAAVAATRLDRLRQLEEQVGFIERGSSGPFFGEGRIGSWQHDLTPVQIAKIESDHGATMRRLGYL